MALALSATDLIEQIEFPRPQDHATADEWVDALFAGEAGARTVAWRRTGRPATRRCGCCG